MRKKISIVLTIFLFLTVVFAGDVFATIDIETYDAGGTYTTIFDWNETPYAGGIIWYSFPNPNPETTGYWEWTSPSSNTYTGDNFYIPSGYGAGRIISPNSPLSNWTSVRKVGDWTVTAYWSDAVYPSGTSMSTNFTVTPEPISSILFLTGGGILAGRSYIKRRMKA